MSELNGNNRIPVANVGDADSKETNQTLQVIDPLYHRYVKSVVHALSSSRFYQYFMDTLSVADNEFQFSNRRMEKIVDQTWVDKIEAALEGFQNIVSSPRNVIKEDELIVNVANARKAGSDVVRHLAQHAALVEDFNENSGDVRPSRLMQKYREDTINLYENRIVFTTLEKAFHFVKVRHDALFEAMSDEFGAKLKLSSDLTSATETVHLDMFMHIRDIESTIETDDRNRDIFDRISRLYRMLTTFMNTPFAQKMMKYARVRGAITKTNVLKKNPNYRKIVALFEFLSSYGDVGYTIKITEQNPVITETFEQDIYHNILFNYLVLKGHLERDKDRRLPPVPEEDERDREIRPKVITEIIEELTEDYDLPDVEIRKVLIEELTKEQLMEQEEEERRRLVEEQEQRKKEEEERRRQEREAEEARLRHEMEVEQERLRHEKEAEEQRLLIERMEREQEDRRRGNLFRQELALLWENLEDRLKARKVQAAEEKAKEDFSDAAEILEATERLLREEAEREEQRRQEEKEQKEHEALLAAEQARREEEERQERLRQEQEAEQRARDMAAVADYTRMLGDFHAAMTGRLRLRADDAEKKRREQEAREADRRQRQQARQSSAN